MMSARHDASADPQDRMLAIVAAVQIEAVEFSDWCIAAPQGEASVVGHIQVSDRRAACRVLEALLGLDARLELDVGPSTADTTGRWSVWIRGHGPRPATSPPADSATSPTPSPALGGGAVASADGDPAAGD